MGNLRKTTNINTHPHRVKHITIVHNNIIENFNDINKTKNLAKSVTVE